MSTPPLLDLPDSACIASVVMTLRRVVGMTSSPFTLEEQSFKWQGEQWQIEFTLPPITKRSVAADWQAFIAKLQGTYGRFLMGDPSARFPRGAASGSPVVNGGGQTGNVLQTDGWTASVTGILLKGDYIQIGTGTSSRLHMVTEDINSNVSGQANIALEPALRYSPSDNSAIIVNSPKGVFRMVDNSMSWSVSPGPVYRLSFQAVEVVNA